MAYDVRITSALSGVTVGQLSYWRRTGAYKPETSHRPALYSFRDLIALRTFAKLRGARSLQATRKALKKLHEIGASDHLSMYKLVLQGRKGIVLVSPDGREGVELVEKPGQLVAVLQLGDVLRPFPLDDIEVPSLFQPRERISVDPAVRGGHPVVKGTRVPFEAVAGLVRDGVALDDVSEFYPSVTADGARDAVDFADYVDLSAHRRMRRRWAA